MDDTTDIAKHPKPALPRLRRELLAHTELLKAMMTALAVIERGETPTGTGAAHAWELLACSAVDETWPPREDASTRILKIVETSRAKLPPYTPVAKAALQAELEIAISAQRSLAFLDAIGEPVPDRMLNLPPGQLARELTKIGFALARRIPGWRD